MVRESSSVRERAKARRRDAILRSAMRLFGEHGYDGTSLALIAAELDISPRTIPLYFPAKIDLALDRATATAESLTAAVTGRPPEQPTIEAVGRWMLEITADMDADLSRLEAAMFETNPELHAMAQARIAGAIDTGAADLAAELGVGREDPVLRMSIGSIVGVVTEYFTAVRAGIDPAEAHATAMRFLRATTATARAALAADTARS